MKTSLKRPITCAIAALSLSAAPAVADINDLVSMSGIEALASQGLQLAVKAEAGDPAAALLGVGLSLLLSSGSSNPDSQIVKQLQMIQQEINALQLQVNTLEANLDRDIAAVLTREFYNSILGPQATIEAQLSEYLNILDDPVDKDHRIKALVAAILDVNNGTQKQLYAIDGAMNLSLSQLLLAPVATPAADWDETGYFQAVHQLLQGLETYRFLATVLIAEARNVRANKANNNWNGDPEGVVDAVAYFLIGDDIQPGGLKQHIIDVGIPISGNGYASMFVPSTNPALDPGQGVIWTGPTNLASTIATTNGSGDSDPGTLTFTSPAPSHPLNETFLGYSSVGLASQQAFEASVNQVAATPVKHSVVFWTPNLSNQT